MSCSQARTLNLANLKGNLSAEQAGALHQHLEGCGECRSHAQSESVLGEVLEKRLPRYSAPAGLKRRLAESWPGEDEKRAPAPVVDRRATSRRVVGIALLAATLVAVAGTTAFWVQRRADLKQLETEVLNDHLRILEGAPLATVTGGLHEVKPWFGGKLDFAPSVRFAGSEGFPLQGGAVEPFLDRRAAVFVYRRRLHTASLMVVHGEGLSFPTQVHTQVIRGYNVVLWKANDQGYALISDLNLPELLELQGQLAAP